MLKKTLTIFLLTVSILLLNNQSNAQTCSGATAVKDLSNAITITWFCQAVQPGQNSPYQYESHLSVTLPSNPNILTGFIFSSASMTTQGGFLLFGGPQNMTTDVSLPDLHGSPFAYHAEGTGMNTTTIPGPFSATNPPDFRIDVSLELNSNIVASCSAYCGYVYVLTLNP